MLKRGAEAATRASTDGLPVLTAEDIDELDDAPDAEIEDAEEKVVDQATAAQTIAELEAEIDDAQGPGRAGAQGPALRHRPQVGGALAACSRTTPKCVDADGHRRKMVIFTEHRDTLNYLADKIRALLGRHEAVVTIHGGDGPRGAPQGPGSASRRTRKSKFWLRPTLPAKASTFSAPT